MDSIWWDSSLFLKKPTIWVRICLKVTCFFHPQNQQNSAGCPTMRSFFWFPLGLNPRFRYFSPNGPCPGTDPLVKVFSDVVLGADFFFQNFAPLWCHPFTPHQMLGGGFNYFLCSPLFGEDFQFDWYFSGWLKPPTSYAWGWFFQDNEMIMMGFISSWFFEGLVAFGWVGHLKFSCNTRGLGEEGKLFDGDWWLREMSPLCLHTVDGRNPAPPGM